MSSDEYTIEMRMCDDEGMVSYESVDEDRDITLANPGLTYLDRLNYLRNLTLEARGDKPKTIEEPYMCTGHAHLAGEHIRCTSFHHYSIADDAGGGNAPKPLLDLA